MVRIGWEGHGLMFVRELATQTSARGEATAVTVGDAIGMDERESANVMAWLAEHWLVREAHAAEDSYCDPFTTAPLTLTTRGRAFADSGELPPPRQIDTITGLEQFSRWGGRPQP